MELDNTMRLSFSTGAAYCYPLSWVFKLAREAGFSGVELVLGPEAIWRGPRAVQEMAVRYGLALYSIHGPIVSLPGWRHLTTNVKRLIAYAAAMDPVPLVVLHVPRDRPEREEISIQRFLDALAVARTRFRTVPIALETPGLFYERNRACALSNVDALFALAEHADVQVVLDTVHVGSFGYDLLQTYRQLRPRLANVHFSDLRDLPPLLDRPELYSYIKHHQLPGRGKLPLRQLLKALIEDGYDRLLTLELSPVALGIWSFRRVRAALAESREFLKAAGLDVSYPASGALPLSHMQPSAAIATGRTVKDL